MEFLGGKNQIVSQNIKQSWGNIEDKVWGRSPTQRVHVGNAASFKNASNLFFLKSSSSELLTLGDAHFPWSWQ